MFLPQQGIISGGAAVETDFVFTWRTTTANEQMALPTYFTHSYNCTVDYGDDTGIKTVTAHDDPDHLHTYVDAGDYEVRISGTFSRIRFALTDEKDKLIKLSNLGEVGLTGDNTGMFENCSNLTHFNIGNTDTSNVTNLESFFQTSDDSLIDTDLDFSGLDVSSCTDLNNFVSYNIRVTSIDITGWDTSACTDFSYFAYSCTNLATITNGENLVASTGVGENFLSMLNGCDSLTGLDVSTWDVSSATSFRNMFLDCYLLNPIDCSSWTTTTALTDIRNMFDDCMAVTTLDLSGFNVTNVSSFALVFFGCESLVSVDLTGWSAASPTATNGMFSGCFDLTTVTGIGDLDMSANTALSDMFRGCSSLVSIDVSWTTSASLNSIFGMFYNCTSLTTMDPSGWNISGMTTATNFLSGANAWTDSQYDDVLVAWAAQSVQDDVSVHFGNATYSTGDPTTARNTLTTPVSPNWTITDGGQA